MIDPFIEKPAPSVSDVYSELEWAVEWMESFEGQTMPGWDAWAVRARQALQRRRRASKEPSE